MPVLPGITDNPRDLEALVKKVSEAGATYVGACALRLQSSARKRYLPFIEQEFPHLAERYRNTYSSGPNAGEKYRKGLSAFFSSLCARYGVRSGSRGEEIENGEESVEQASLPEQLLLAFESA
jgi:DNA repair photolyase